MGVEDSIWLRRLLVIAIAVSICVGLGFPDATMAQPKGQRIITVDFSKPPASFGPAETPTSGTPHVLSDALSEALIKPSPGDAISPFLIESWTATDDGLSVELTRLRVMCAPMLEGATLHMASTLDERR
jgi:ABC-type transport system substrate-binding protein